MKMLRKRKPRVHELAAQIRLDVRGLSEELNLLSLSSKAAIGDFVETQVV